MTPEGFVTAVYHAFIGLVKAHMQLKAQNVWFLWAPVELTPPPAEVSSLAERGIRMLQPLIIRLFQPPQDAA